jgi:titin
VPPGAPAGLSANAVSASQIDLAWGAASGTVADYRIERSTSSGGAFAQIDAVAAGTLTYNNTGLASATEYFYRVRACNLGGCSGYSNVASDTTFLVPPTPPTSVTATAVSSTQINVAWSGATGVVATYNVFRKDSISGTGYQVVASGTGTSYSDNSVAAATKYFYQVRACNLAGCSGMSPDVSATTFPPPPSAPGALTATAVSASQIDLAWGASTGTVSKYLIERKTSGAYAVIDSTTSTSYSNTGLSASTQYFYRVSACNVSGCSSPTSEATATTQAVPPPAPTGAKAVISGFQIAVSWTASPGTVANYQIERRAGGGTFALFMTVSGSSTSWVDNGPFTVPLPDYAYRIQACNSAGCSTYSNVANAQ